MIWVIAITYQVKFEMLELEFVIKLSFNNEPPKMNSPSNNIPNNLLTPNVHYDSLHLVFFLSLLIRQILIFDLIT